MMKKIILAILIIINLTTLTGCWNYKELNNLLIVTGVCIDKNEDNTYHLTIEVVDFSGSGKEAQVKSALIESNGSTMFDAVRNAIKYNSYKLYWSNCQIIIISKDIAKDGIAPVIDFFIRHTELRKTISPLISTEDTAKAIISKKAVGSTLVAFEIDRSLENNDDSVTTASNVNINQIFNIISGTTTSLVLPCVSVSLSNDELITKVDGDAVFNKDKLIGFLTSEETKYTSFASNKVKSTVLPGRIGEDQKKDNYTLEIFSNNTKISFKNENDKITFKLEIETEAAISEIVAKKNYIDSSEKNELTHNMESKLKDNIESVIKKVQQDYGVDIFGFGDYLNKHDPGTWNKYKDNWNDNFKKANIEVISKIKIRNSALVRQPLKVGE